MLFVRIDVTCKYRLVFFWPKLIEWKGNYYVSILIKIILTKLIIILIKNERMIW